MRAAIAANQPVFPGNFINLPDFEVIAVHSDGRIIAKDREDDKFIRCALTGKAQFIISGDHHLLAMKSYRKIKILPPADFLLKV